MKRPLQKRQAGLSLLELLVAVAIMAMGLGLIYQSSLSSVRAASDLAWQQRASLLAQSLLDARDGVPAAGWHEAGRSADIDWRVDSAPLPLPPGLNTGTPPLHEVTIVLEWPGRAGGARQMQLRTLLPQLRPQPGEALR
jgi:general secretion pathway protein I